MSQTVREFINDYQGFDFENGEIVIVDQRCGKQIICHTDSADVYQRTFSEEHNISENTVLLSGGQFVNYWAPGILNKTVWHWTHSFKTMLIIV